MPDPLDPFQEVPPTTVTINDVTQQEVDPRAKAKLEALGQKDAGWFSNIWAHFWASVKDGGMYVATEFSSGLDEVLAWVADWFRKAQGEQNSSFYDLSAAILGDLTGVEVDAEALKQSAFGSGRLAAMQTFGADLYTLLEEEFKPTGGNLEDGDAGPAERFIGFLMNFSVRQGNVEALCAMLPEEFRIGEGFRAYGELMAKNLGLGRLARRALQPLIQILVSDPLMYKLQEQYRPKRIGATPAIKKFFRDPTFETQLRKELGQEGYTDDRINDLIDDLRPLLSPADIFTAVFRTGQTVSDNFGLGDSFYETQLKRHGYTANDIATLVQANRPFLNKAEIGELFTNGIIDHDVASGFMAKLGYDNDTAELVLRAHSLQHQHPKHLGLSELRKAFHNNVIDLLELKAQLSSQGYSDDDVQIITLDLLQPATGKVRQLSLSEIRAGYKAGVLTKEQVREHLKALSYSDSDANVIVESLPGPKAPATPATPAS